MVTKRFPTWLRVSCFFVGLLLNFLLASLLFEWSLVLRLLLAIPIGFATGIGSYGVIPTKDNIYSIKAHLISKGMSREADNMGVTDWLSWVFWCTVVGALVQILQTVLE